MRSRDKHLGARKENSMAHSPDQIQTSSEQTPEEGPARDLPDFQVLPPVR
jgi:hypothetical protein